MHRLTRTARGLLEEAGHRASDQTVERVASSLRAASVDENGRRLLEQGRFEDDFEGAGLLALAGLTSAAAPKRGRAPARKAGSADDDRAERDRRREELKAARARVREAEKAEHAATEARKAAEQAERRAEAAGSDAELARIALDEARAEAEALENSSPGR